MTYKSSKLNKNTYKTLRNNIHSHENMQKACTDLKNYINLPEYYNNIRILRELYKTSKYQTK